MIQLPYASIVESVHVVSNDACLSVSCLETGVTCDDLHSCVFDVGVEQRRRKMDAGQAEQQQQQQQSPIDLTTSQSDSFSLYNITPHHAQRSQVMHDPLVLQQYMLTTSGKNNNDNNNSDSIVSLASLTCCCHHNNT